MYGQKKNFSTSSYKLVQISPIMILVHSGAFLSISSWFCELTELIFVMIPYISSTGCPPTTQRIMGHVQVANLVIVLANGSTTNNEHRCSCERVNNKQKTQMFLRTDQRTSNNHGRIENLVLELFINAHVC